ncbi:MAG: aconitase family protein, partial [Rhodospirillales bacterium]
MTKKSQNIAHKILGSHLVGASMVAGQEIQLKVDHLLMQDALSALTMLALEAMELDRIKIELACQYVDHNLFQADFRNPDDHVFLRSCCQRFGMHYSAPGNGISHPTHQERFGVPGKLLVGTDSHTPAAGAIGMIGIGVGSIEGASILAGEPLNIPMPEIMGVKLTGTLPDWVSAKDVILEMLRRHTVKGAVGRIIEYYGPGVATLSAMDRHVIANMGTELGATSCVFPADERVREFLVETGRKNDYTELLADEGCDYDHHDEINLSSLEPLIAKPSSPDNVVPVREVAGAPIYQSYIGS